VNHRRFPIDVLVAGISFGEIIGLAVGLTNIVELVFIEGATHHDSTHLEVLVVLLVELPLLPPRLLSEDVYVNSSLNSLIWLFSLLPLRFHQ
jgi:hypothetical protein